MKKRYREDHALACLPRLISKWWLFTLILSLIFCFGAGIKTDGKASVATPLMRGRIVYSAERDGNFEICVMNPDGTGQSRLTDEVALDRRPSISPNGKQIVWESYRHDVSASIYIMSTDGSHQRRLGAGSFPAFSPNGRQIVFVTAGFNIALMNIDGKVVKVLTQGKTRDTQPHFSPDGRRIVFASGRDFSESSGDRSEIYVMDIDGSHVKRLTELSVKEPAAKGNPIFSLDGRTIAFDTRIVGEGYGFSTGFISLIIENGKGERRLTSDDWFCAHPSFSLDGRRLVLEATFKTMTGDPKQGIYVMNADGTKLTRIEAGSATGERSPSWGMGAPIGKTLALNVPTPPPLPMLELTRTSEVPNVPIPVLSPEIRLGRLVHLWFVPRPAPGVYRVSGKVYVVLYKETMEDSPLVLQIKGIESYSGSRNTKPSFSPDGRYVLFEFTQKGINYSRSLFYVWDTTTLRLQPAPTYLLDGYFQSWSPDGNYLLFVSSSQKASSLSNFLVVAWRTGRQYRLPRQVSSGFNANWLAPHRLLYTRYTNCNGPN